MSRIVDWFRALVGRRGRAAGGPAPAPQVPPKKPIHWVGRSATRPACGAVEYPLWTSEPSQATCPTCKRRGEMVSLKRFTNVR